MISTRAKEFGLAVAAEKQQKSLRYVVALDGLKIFRSFGVTLDAMKVFKDVVLPKAQAFFAKSFSGKVVAAVFVVGFVLGIILF